MPLGMRPPFKLTGKLFLTAFSGAAFLGGAELVVRFHDRWDPPMPKPERTPIRPCADPRIRFENDPGARQTIRYRDRAGNVRCEVVEVSAQGTRGREVQPDKPPGTLRVVVLGDSQTFGAGIPADGTWPAVVERTLRLDPDLGPVEVMNCSVAGYDAEQSAAALETRWLAFDPDLVLLGYFVNDVPMPPRGVVAPDPVGRRLLTIVTPGSKSLVATLRRSSALVDVLSDALYDHLRGRQWAIQANFLHSDASPGWARTKAAILCERDLCRDRGVAFGVVLLPFLVPWSDGLISSAAYRRLTDFCAEQGIPAYDPEPLFAGRDLESLLVHPKDLHSGAEAHRLQGEGVAGWVLDRDLIPRKSVRN